MLTICKAKTRLKHYFVKNIASKGVSPSTTKQRIKNILQSFMVVVTIRISDSLNETSYSLQTFI